MRTPKSRMSATPSAAYSAAKARYACADQEPRDRARALQDPCERDFTRTTDLQTRCTRSAATVSRQTQRKCFCSRIQSGEFHYRRGAVGRRRRHGRKRWLLVHEGVALEKFATRHIPEA